MDTRVGSANGGIQTCIANCMRCHGFCLKSASHCLTLERDLDPVATLLVCADVCRVCADTMIRGSALHLIVCEACSKICARCADECENVENDALLRECAAACLTCADCCAAMIAQAA
jgi:hypothetical protein